MFVIIAVKNLRSIVGRNILYTLNNKGSFGNNNQSDTLISKRLSVENKAKLSQLTRADFVTMVKVTY